MLARLSSLFPPMKRIPPPAHMRTIPCTPLDLWHLNTVFNIGLIIDTPLDTKKLKRSLWTLVERKFPRAGARLVQRNGMYEFQIPYTFDVSTPPVAFTMEEYSEPYGCSGRPKLPIHLPDSFDASKPSVHPLPALGEYFASKECPTSLDGFLVPNTPAVHVHVATFQDITFIGFTTSHVILDGLGARTLLHAWTRLLSGEPIDTIQGMEWDAQPFNVFMRSTATVAPIRSGMFDLGIFSRLRFNLDRMRDPKLATHLVRVPRSFLDDSKRDINASLQFRGSGEWVGSSDVLLAWWFKTAYGYRRIDDETPIHIHLPVDLREIPIFPGPLTDPYIHNAVSLISLPPIPANAFRTDSLAELALRTRRAITEFNADADGIAADLRWAFANPQRRFFPCPPGGEFLMQSSWRKARFGELDFSGAGEVKADVLFVMLLYPSGAETTGTILMEDKDAMWMTQPGGETHWENIRRSGTVAFV
ncbi:hypothetical protein B0H17DRAFT_33801 [Mycena rosella]|uniref:Uncharacterized protein n=1 Tax=Mycena rosella TaxID=1033263 RepID=A0AAD7D8D0_MYCRO|nr:hypothetical protein B0H17DRAFT_33801 [Mycena rosella]